ncbi:hypothetical protein V6N13_131344 [Hibiscus sabdariffa]
MIVQRKAPSFISSLPPKTSKFFSALFRSRCNHLPYNRRLGFRSTTSGKFSLNSITDRRVRNQSPHCSRAFCKAIGAKNANIIEVLV